MQYRIDIYSFIYYQYLNITSNTDKDAFNKTLYCTKQPDMLRLSCLVMFVNRVYEGALSLKNKVNSIISLNFETFAFWCFIVGTALSAFGSVLHYTGWSLALLALLYGKIRYKTAIIARPPKSRYPILAVLVVTFLWSMIANSIAAASFASASFTQWGRSVSIPLEMLLAIFLVIRLVDNKNKLEKFAIAIIIGAILANFYFIFITPFTKGLHQNLVSGNALGIYNILVMPIFFCYSFWCMEKRQYLAILLCIINILSLLSNFSSGPWLAGFFQAIIILIYALKDKKISIAYIGKALAMLLLLLVVCDIATNNFILKRLDAELNQAKSINDMNTFTTKRTEIWYVAVEIIKDRPLTGVGRGMFDACTTSYIPRIPGHIRCTDGQSFNQPHNMYLGFLTDAGIPSFLLFMAAFLLSIIKSFKINRIPYEKKIPWGIVCFAVFVGQMIHGIGCDVFEVRSDMAPVFWAIWGVLISLPDTYLASQKIEQAKPGAFTN